MHPAANAWYESWRRDIESLPVPPNFSTLILQAARDYSDRTALDVFEDGERLSFSQLSRQVQKLASGLHQRGVRKGSHVAVLLNNRIEFPLTWLALAWLGAVMVPTNTRSKARELDYQYNDADAGFLIVDDSLLEQVELMEQRPVALGDSNIFVCGAEKGPYTTLEEIIASGTDNFSPPTSVNCGDLLNIQYTSGTTGLPKGCMQSQDYWLTIGTVVAGAQPDVDSVLADHPFFYMDPQWMVVFALLRGARMCLARGMSSSRFLDWAIEQKFELAYFPKPLLKQIPTDRDRAHHLKRFTVGAMSSKTVRQVEERFGVSVEQNYGMTEIGAGLIVPRQISDPDMDGTLGVITPHREMKVVDPDGNEVPDGEPGELIVRGRGLFKGYYNKPEADQSSFFSDWFRTGDLFVHEPSGYFRIVGRVKDMIRRSSENISALEVEQTVMDIPDVLEAAAVPVADDYRGEEVKIYVRLRPGLTAQDVSPQSIIEYCRKQLAAFKCPRYLEYVDEFPYTPSQKIAKHVLISGRKDLRENSYDSQKEAGHR